MNIHHKALVLVADGKKFLLLRNVGTFEAPELVVEASGQQENPPTRDQGTDQPGRSAASLGDVHSAMEPTDFHQLEEDRFAADIANLLDAWVANGEMPELVVVAPPRTLAQFRKHFSAAIGKTVVAEVAKDLTKHPVDEIARILSRDE